MRRRKTDRPIPPEERINGMIEVDVETTLTNNNVVDKSSTYFIIKSRSYSSASRWNLS